MTSPAFVCVYRHRNAHRVLPLVKQGLGLRGAVSLWALDEVHPDLAEWTTGCGPGHRITLLNRALEVVPAKAPLVVFDDDVEILRGGLGTFLRWGARAGLDIFQPAHSYDSHVNHSITLRQTPLPVRRTTFVEVGPLVGISAKGRALATPFPERFQMGWGLDVYWSRLGLALGIVDEVEMRHLDPTGVSYSVEQSESVLTDELGSAGIEHISEIQTVLESWPQSRVARRTFRLLDRLHGD